MPDMRETHSTFDTLLAFVIAACAAAICRLASGPSLGQFLGSVALAGVIVSPLALLRGAWKSRFLAVVAAVDGVGLVWLLSVVQGHIGLFQWIWCFLILAALAFAVAGIAWSCEAVGINSIVSCGIAMTVALVWLAWPIWFSPHQAGSGVSDAAIGVHPLFAINGALPQLGIWTEHALMYRLTNLGQDVPYILPPPYYSIVTHAMIAGLLIAVSYSLSYQEQVRVKADAPVEPLS